jgi:hypothetical protein
VVVNLLVVIVTNLRGVSTAWNITNNSFWRLVVAVTSLFLVPYETLTHFTHTHTDFRPLSDERNMIWIWSETVVNECTLNTFTYRPFSDSFRTCLASRTFHMWSLQWTFHGISVLRERRQSVLWYSLQSVIWLYLWQVWRAHLQSIQLSESESSFFYFNKILILWSLVDRKESTSWRSTITQLVSFVIFVMLNCPNRIWLNGKRNRCAWTVINSYQEKYLLSSHHFLEILLFLSLSLSLTLTHIHIVAFTSGS